MQVSSVTLRGCPQAKSKQWVNQVGRLSLIIGYNSPMNRKSTPNPKLIITIVAAVLLIVVAVVGFLAYRSSQNTANQQGQATDVTPAALQPADITDEAFSYSKPQGWAKLSKERLEASAAVSGIGLPSTDLTKLPVATVTVQASDAAPKDDND